MPGAPLRPGCLHSGVPWGKGRHRWLWPLGLGQEPLGASPGSAPSLGRLVQLLVVTQAEGAGGAGNRNPGGVGSSTESKGMGVGRGPFGRSPGPCLRTSSPLHLGELETPGGPGEGACPPGPFWTGLRGKEAVLAALHTLGKSGRRGGEGPGAQPAVLGGCESSLQACSHWWVGAPRGLEPASQLSSCECAGFGVQRVSCPSEPSPRPWLQPDHLPPPSVAHWWGCREMGVGQARGQG